MKNFIAFVCCMGIYFNCHAQDIRDHRNGKWTLLHGSDGKDVSINTSGELILLNTAGKLYKYKDPDWKQTKSQFNIKIYSENSTYFFVTGDGMKYSGTYTYYETPQILSPLELGIYSKADIRDIGVDSDSSMWLTEGNGNILFWDRSIIELKGTDAVRIAAGAGQIWMINTAGKIYKYIGPKYPDPSKGRLWQQMPGSDGRDIAVSNDGSVWLVNTAGKIYQWYGSNWTQVEGSDGSRIAANNGKVLLLNTAGKLFLRTY